MIDVEQRALRALEQDALALAALQIQQPPYRFGIGQEFGRKLRQFAQDATAIDLFQIQSAP